MHRISSFDDSGDIRDLVKTKISPIPRKAKMPRLPPTFRKLSKGKSKARDKMPADDLSRSYNDSMSEGLKKIRSDHDISNNSNSTSNSKSISKSKRSRSNDRAMHKRMISKGFDPSGKKEDLDHYSDTNSTSDSDNERTAGSISVPVLSSINQLPTEEDVYRRRPERDGEGNCRSQSVKRRQGRSRSVSRDPGDNRSASVKTEGKGLFGGRLRSQSRSRARSRDVSEKKGIFPRMRSLSRGRPAENEKVTRQSRGISRSRAPSTTRASSKARVPRISKTSSRARSRSRARSKSRTRGKSIKSSKTSKSDTVTGTGKTRSKSKSRTRSKSKGKTRSSSVANRKILKDTISPVPKRSSLQPYMADSDLAIGSLSMGSDSIDSMASPRSPRAGQRKPKNLLASPASSKSSRKSKSSLKLRLIPPLVGGITSTINEKSDQSDHSDISEKKTRSAPQNRRGSLDSLFPPIAQEYPLNPSSNEAGIAQRRNSVPEGSAKEWQADLTTSMTDDASEANPVDSFEKLWGKDSERKRVDVTKKEDENVTISNPIPTPTTNGGCQTQKVDGADDEQMYESIHQIKAITDQVTILEDELDAKDANLQMVERQLRATLVDSDRTKKESDEELEELKNQITDLQDALDARGSQIETLQRQLDVAYSENNTEMYNAEVKLKGFREKIASIQEILDKKTDEVEKLKRKLENVECDHENKIGEERGESHTQLNDFREQVTALQDALDEKETQVFKMQGHIDEANCENKILMEELDQLLNEKNEAESRAMAGTTDRSSNADTRERIKELESELEDASKVANLQLEELDEQVDGLREKLKAERADATSKIKSRDAAIDELSTKLRRYEAVPSATSHSYNFQPSVQSSLNSKHKHSHSASADSVASEKSVSSFAAASGVASYALTDLGAETPAINTNDVTDVESAKQKVYEARADATSVRESLEISTKRCAELTLANEHLVKKNSELVDTTRERDELKDNVRDWTAQTYQWKRRAEDAESKLTELTNDGADSKNTNNNDSSDHQGLMIKAAMENRSGRGMGDKAEKKGWSLFGRTANANSNSEDKSSHHFENRSNSDDEESSEAKDARIECLTEAIAKLRSEMFQMTTTHKEETYLTKKRIANLEGENEALTLQNGTLEQLSRFHSES